MTKLEIINLIKQQMHEAKWHFDNNLDTKGEDDRSTIMAYSEYYTLKWLLDDIKEAEAGMVFDK